MTDDLRVQQLLDELLGSHATPEVVCASCPELLPVVRNRWRQICRVRADLDVLFPPPDEPTPQPAEGTALPRIPGYEVEAVLGRGGMGIVYKARDLRLGRLVALKMLLAGPNAGVAERERFMREAEAMAGLRHANIVQVHGAGDHDGRLYFTMEYVEGGSLGQHLAGTPQPAREAAALLATLAAAVQVAHQGGIVHRDLKPATILLTSDGTPKIADFGLARHFDSGSALTLSGTPVGTPSYMAPEQAMGQARTIGPATDIYALGAVLYEMLTGRPPFRAETAVETHLQVIHQEPVPPSRLNARVPRDLETICLTCLHKTPERRYATAAALAEDLQRFRRGEPIAARPAGLVERTGKWVRQHPTGSALLAASFLLAVLLVGASFWLVVQQSNLRHAVEADLKEVAELQDSARWAEAQVTLERAEARLGGGGPDDLRRRIAQARRDLALVMRLDNIRLKRATRGELVFYKAQANKAYAEAFQQEGLGKVHDPPASVAAAVRASAVRGALVAALDDWATCIADNDQRDWLLEVARQADPDREGWRDRILDPKAWDDPVALAEWARTVPVATRSVSLPLALGERLTAARRDATPLLKRVQKEHPGDFWANLILGNALLPLAPQAAEGYYRVALALRPRAAVGYCAVGDALRLQNDLAEATEYYRKALQLDAGYARAHSDLGLTLQAQGRPDEAIPCYRQAVQLDPDYAWAHHNLASALRVKGLLDEAYDHCQQAIRLDPNNAEVKAGLTGVISLMQGKASKVMGPAPRLILAMAQHQQGQKKQARKTLAVAIIGYDWSAAHADRRDIWINHILRREAEALILPDLPAFLEGKYRPQDNDERLALLGVCQFRGLHVAAARLYADAFAADPRLADDLGVGHRYSAARAAAQAGCGRGTDAAGVEPTERARWRRQAREWLRADLTARVRVLDSNPAGARGDVRKALTHWREDPDLACVRDPGGLNKLAADERKEYLALWAEVAAVLARTEK
jgi:serine/threonine-protein kinase